jgi:NhaA family Na+:H+ antiporter
MVVIPGRAVNAIREFLKLESASGIILVGAAVLALILNNSPLSSLYDLLINTPVEIRIGAFQLAKPLLLWINDGLMAVFFLLIGLEIKREVMDGQLSSLSQVALPGIAALGGMIVPALIYVFFNFNNTGALHGWAIPAATDIAFALGIMMLLGSRVPVSLKLFLLTLAIIDDLGAIVIIAIFYTGKLSLVSLAFAGVTVAALAAMNLLGVKRIAAYVIVGVILWLCVLKSGVHATLAGVALAFAIPLRTKDDEPCPLRDLEHTLHPWVAFGIMPVFAFANAGVSLEGMSFRTLFEPIPVGVALGLFLGKQLGVFGFAKLCIKLGLARMPEGATWLSLYGTSVLCGIGFTMSLFIGTLAFDQSMQIQGISARLGILTGSFLSAVSGYLLLKYSLGKQSVRTDDQ